MEDLILKLPREWQGVIGALSRPDKPILSAQYWLLEQSNLSWTNFLISLCKEVPVLGQEKQLLFKPEILLYPVDIQRNLMSFLLQQQENILSRDLTDLVEALQRQTFHDGWMQFLVKQLQLVLQKRSSGKSNIDFLQEYSFSSKVSNLCKEINNCNHGNENQQFEWLPGYLSQFKQKDEVTATFTEVNVNTTTSQIVKTENEEQDAMDMQIDDIVSKQDEIEKTNNISPCLVSKPPSTDDVIVIGSSSDEDEEVDIRDEMEIDANRRNESVVNDDVAMETEIVTNQLDDETKVALNRLIEAIDGISFDGNEAQTLTEMEIFTSSTAQQVESICTQMELSSSSETFLHNFCHVICNLNPEPSFSNCCVIAKHCFLDKLQQLQQNVSRSLLMSIVKFCESFPKPAIEVVLVPIACSNLGSPQVDVISRLTRETLSGEMRLHVYRSLCNIDMKWNPSTSILFQTLLNTKLDLDEGTLTKFLSLLEHHRVSQQKCLKFGKVLLTTINKYGKQFSPSLVTVMSHILDVNRTYLKKTSAAALKKL